MGRASILSVSVNKRFSEKEICFIASFATLVCCCLFSVFCVRYVLFSRLLRKSRSSKQPKTRLGRTLCLPSPTIGAGRMPAAMATGSCKRPTSIAWPHVACFLPMPTFPRHPAPRVAVPSSRARIFSALVLPRTCIATGRRAATGSIRRS